MVLLKPLWRVLFHWCESKGLAAKFGEKVTMSDSLWNILCAADHNFSFTFFFSLCWPPHWWESSCCCALPVAQRLPITFAYTMWKKMLDVERGSYGREGCVCWQVSPTGKMLRLSFVSKKWIVIDCRFRSSYFWRCIVMMHITIYIYWWQLIHPHRADRPR